MLRCQGWRNPARTLAPCCQPRARCAREGDPGCCRACRGALAWRRWARASGYADGLRSSSTGGASSDGRQRPSGTVFSSVGARHLPPFESLRVSQHRVLRALLGTKQASPGARSAPRRSCSCGPEQPADGCPFHRELTSSFHSQPRQPTAASTSSLAAVNASLRSSRPRPRRSSARRGRRYARLFGSRSTTGPVRARGRPGRTRRRRGGR
jgi:hypothetical protein